MDMPSVYSPFKMDTSFHKMPFEEMGRFTEMVKNKYETNAQSLDNFSSALSDIKTYPEAMPELQAKLKRYQDFTDQSAKLASTDPEKYLQLSNQLRETGRELVRDMKSGDISKYTKAYADYNTSYAKDLNDPNKLPSEVNLYYAKKAKEDIANLKAGKPITQGQVQDYFDSGKALDAAVKEVPITEYRDELGQLVTGRDPKAVTAAISGVYSDPRYKEYIQGAARNDPSIAGPAIIGETADKKKVFWGKIRDENVKGKDVVYKTDSAGNIVYGKTPIEKDAISKYEYDLENIADIYRTKYSGGSIKLDASGDKPGSTSGNQRLPILSDAPTQLNNVTTPPPVYQPGAELAKLNAPRGNKPSINDTLANNYASTEERQAALNERDNIFLEQRNANNRHNQIREVAFQKMHQNKGATKEDIELLTNVDNYKNQVDKTMANLSKLSPWFDKEARKLGEQELATNVAKYKKARVLKDEYNSLYFKENASPQNNQANQNKGLSIGGDKDLQEAASTTLLDNIDNLTVEGDNQLTVRDTLLNNLNTKKSLSDSYLFGKLVPMSDGKIKIQAIDLNSKKNVNFIVNSSAATKIQEVIKVGKYDRTTKNFASEFTNPVLKNGVMQVENAPLPSSNANYGPVTEINYGNVRAFVRKTPEGGIIGSIIDPQGRTILVPIIKGNDSNGEFIDQLNNYIRDSNTYIQNIEASKNAIVAKGGSINDYFANPNDVHILDSKTYKQNEDKREKETTISPENVIAINKQPLVMKQFSTQNAIQNIGWDLLKNKLTP